MKRTKQDVNWSNRIRERDNFTCQMCGNISKHVQAHHILPRTIKAFRHEEYNGITLCYGCHKVGRKSAHQNAVYFSIWLSKNKPEVYHFISELCKRL